MTAPTAEEDALVAALLWLRDSNLDGERLTEASFGLRADGTGCWWRLRFQRDVITGEVEDTRQDHEARYTMVVQAWNQALGTGCAGAGQAGPA